VTIHDYMGDGLPYVVVAPAKDVAEPYTSGEWVYRPFYIVSSDGANSFSHGLPGADWWLNYHFGGTATPQLGPTPAPGDDFGPAPYDPWLSGQYGSGYESQGYERFLVDVYGDNLVEGTETITLTADSGDTYRVSPWDTATVKLFDATPPEDSTVSIEAVDPTAMEGSQASGAYRISRTGDLSNSLAVNLSFSGTAINGIDTSYLNPTVVIPAGSDHIVVPVTAISDGVPEWTENLVVHVEDGLYVHEEESAEITIEDAERSQAWIRDLTFSGAGYRSVVRDNIEDLPVPKRYSPPHWLDQDGNGRVDDKGDQMVPALYVWDNYVTVSIAIAFRDPNAYAGRNVMVEGDGPNGLTFQAQAVVNGNRLTANGIRSNNKLPNKVDYYDGFEIKWKISADGGNTWLPAGVSKVRLYVTFAAPQLTACLRNRRGARQQER
jgi:hypothetical protein